jgi:alanine racemase
MSLVSEIVFIKDVPAGATIGYHPGYSTTKATRIATLPIGYDHGYSYMCSNRSKVIIRGEEAPVVGRISMDYTTVDVGHIQGVAVGDRVVLIGSQKGKTVRAEDLAQIVETIPYEITSRLGRRVRRVFKEGEKTLRGGRGK